MIQVLFEKIFDIHMKKEVSGKTKGPSLVKYRLILSTNYYQLTFYQIFKCIELPIFIVVFQKSQSQELSIMLLIQRWFKELREFQEKSLRSSETHKFIKFYSRGDLLHFVRM